MHAPRPEDHLTKPWKTEKAAHKEPKCPLWGSGRPQQGGEMESEEAELFLFPPSLQAPNPTRSQTARSPGVEHTVSASWSGEWIWMSKPKMPWCLP